MKNINKKKQKYNIETETSILNLATINSFIDTRPTSKSWKNEFQQNSKFPREIEVD